MKKSLTVFVVLITVIVLSCAVGRAQTNPNPQLIERAKKEGQLVYWSTMTVNQSKAVVDAFRKKYPFIEVNLYRTGGDAMVNKALTEARAGRHEWDVINTRGDLFRALMKEKLLASYHSPEAMHIPADLVDKEGYWTAYYVNPYGLGYNTSMVKKSDVPRTYEELLDPKWKGGKISIDNTAYNFLSGLMSAWGKEKAVSYFRKLAAQEPVPMRGNTHRVQLVMAGEFPLIIAYIPTIQRATSVGGPVDWVALEPAPVQVNAMFLGSKAPHGNAARLFIDYALSKEGQKQLVGFQRIPVHEDVDPEPARLFKGYKRIVEGPEDYENYSELIKLYQDILNIR